MVSIGIYKFLLIAQTHILFGRVFGLFQVVDPRLAQNLEGRRFKLTGNHVFQKLGNSYHNNVCD